MFIKVFGMVVIVSGMIAVGATDTVPCAEKCSNQYSPRLRACGEVEQCIAFVKQEYNSCMRKCGQ